jgi:hypothetical protein
MSTRAKRLARALTWCAGIAAMAGTAAAAPAFHAAQSAAEQTLGRILKADENPHAHVDPTAGAVGRRPRTTPPPGAPYLKYLTTPLATAILVEEAREVKANCGGVYKAGELCGMDADPIICAQDFPDHYLFRTIQSGPDLAVIEAAWPPDKGAEPSRSGAYRLTLSGGAWKIDGISCADGEAYNWSPKTAKAPARP